MDPQSAKLLAAAIALLPIFGVGIGLGLLFSAWMSAVGRNPEAAPGISRVGYIALGLTEALGIFALAVSLLILFIF